MSLVWLFGSWSQMEGIFANLFIGRIIDQISFLLSFFLYFVSLARSCYWDANHWEKIIEIALILVQKDFICYFSSSIFIMKLDWFRLTLSENYWNYSKFGQNRFFFWTGNQMGCSEFIYPSSFQTLWRWKWCVFSFLINVFHWDSVVCVVDLNSFVFVLYLESRCS